MPADAELSRHDPDVPDWDSLPPDARRLAARMMEVYAGFLSHTDHHIGRLLDFLKEAGEFDNTMIMVVSDNGASAEGGPTGTTNELQFFNNAPEPLDALSLDPPATVRGVTQSPIHGVSFVHTFDSASATTRHRTQYFEMLGHRAIDHDGWRAVCPWPGPSFTEAGKPFGVPITAADLTDLDAHHWELYHITEDPAENHNLAENHRDKLIELIAMWYTEAGNGPPVSRLSA